MDTLQKLEKIIADYKPVESGTLTPQTSFESLQLDSLDLVDMAMACEDAFGVPVEVNADLKTVGDLIAIIEAGA